MSNGAGLGQRIGRWNTRGWKVKLFAVYTPYRQNLSNYIYIVVRQCIGCKSLYGRHGRLGPGQGEYNVIKTEAAVWGALLFSPAIIDVSIFSAFARREYNKHNARYTMTTLFLSACCIAWLGDRIVRDTTSRSIVLHRFQWNRTVSSRLLTKTLILKQAKRLEYFYY